MSRKRRKKQQRVKPVAHETLTRLGNLVGNHEYCVVHDIGNLPRGVGIVPLQTHITTTILGTTFVGPEAVTTDLMPALNTTIFFQKTYRLCNHDGTGHANADIYVYWTAQDGSCYRTESGMSPDHYAALVNGSCTPMIGSWLVSDTPETGQLDEAGFSIRIELTGNGPRSDF